MPQVAFDHGAKVFFHCFRNFRVSVTRQIHEVHPVIDQKEVNRLRPARRRTRSSQSMSVRQSVQQAGFANIRSATKSNFGPLISGKIIRSSCTLYESGGTDLHDWQF
jgi:hypothetical protein